MFNWNKIKDRAYVINLDEYKSIETHWIALYVNDDYVTYFDSFGAEHIQEEIKKFISNKNIKTAIYRIQLNDSIISWNFCIVFVGFMVKCKSLLDYAILFFSSEYENNDKITLKCFQ